jgi:hypothetical protein
VIAWLLACGGPSAEPAERPAPAPTEPAPTTPDTTTPPEDTGEPSALLLEDVASGFALSDRGVLVSAASWTSDGGVWLVDDSPFHVPIAAAGVLASDAQLTIDFASSPRQAPLEADFDTDGTLDLVVLSPSETTNFGLLLPGPLPSVGVITPDAGIGLGAWALHSDLAGIAADFDGDGGPGLLLHPLGRFSTSIGLIQDVGVTPDEPVLLDSTSVPEPSTADLDGDGVLDLAVLLWEAFVPGRIALCTGPIHALDLDADAETYLDDPTLSHDTAIATGDVDGDGATDLLVELGSPARLAMCLGPLAADCLRTPDAAATTDGGRAILDLAVADADEDGTAEIASSTGPAYSAGLTIAILDGWTPGTSSIPDTAARTIYASSAVEGRMRLGPDGALAVIDTGWEGLSAGTSGAAWFLDRSVWP